MLNLPMVVAGEYSDYNVLGVFADETDAREFCRRYNDERGYGTADDMHARIESVPGFPAGDAGASWHEVEVEYVDHRFASGWRWSCRCGQGGGGFAEKPGAQNDAAEHIAHWVDAAAQPALP